MICRKEQLMIDTTTMDQTPIRRRGGPAKALTELERIEVRTANDRKYYNQNKDAKQEKVKQYYNKPSNEEYILERKRNLYVCMYVCSGRK